MDFSTGFFVGQGHLLPFGSILTLRQSRGIYLQIPQKCPVVAAVNRIDILLPYHLVAGILIGFVMESVYLLYLFGAKQLAFAAVILFVFFIHIYISCCYQSVVWCAVGHCLEILFLLFKARRGGNDAPIIFFLIQGF